MAGLGLQPVGMTPFGVGTPAEAQAPPESPPDAARFLNPISGDYEIGSDGEIKRMPAIRQRVLLALSTTRGSSTVLPNFGLKLPDRIDNRYAQRAEQAIREALRFLTDAKEISIRFVRVNLTNVTGRVEHIVSYSDLTTGNSDTVTI